MLYYLATGLYMLVCFTMMLVVYLQQGKGGDIASAFGGGGSSQSAFGARSGATVLSRATTVCAILFMVGALALGILGKRGPGSVVGGRAPLTQPSSPATTSPAKAPVPAGAPSVPANNAAPAPPRPAAPAPSQPAAPK